MIPSDLMPFWLTLGRPLTRLLFAMCIGLLIANIVEALRWTQPLARLSAPLVRLARLREALPGFEVVVREHRRPRVTPRTQNIPKFVSYEKMEAYIRLLPDGDALMERYRLVRAFAKCRRNSASIVFRWFNESFPDYRKPPRLDRDGRLIAAVRAVAPEALCPGDETLPEVG